MKILLTNDDGIRAPGLRALHRVLAPEHEVWVVAPESEQSAVGHAITLQTPLRVRKVYENGELYGFGVSGTPADCVKIGVAETLPGKPDLVVSGINLGPNVGINVLYSGTVSAATEGAILGLPALAFSLATYREPDFSFAARFAGTLIARLNWSRFPARTVFNVNVPALPSGCIKGVRFTRQTLAAPLEKFDRRRDPRDNVYYWLAEESAAPLASEDEDATALRSDWVTITPLHFDLTNYEVLDRLADSAASDLLDPSSLDPGRL